MSINSSALPDFTPQDLAIIPLAQAETIPSAWYTDPRFHDFEREAIFARTWQAVGHFGQLQQPGDAIHATVAGNPIVVVRDMDGSLRAFFNVCRHRAGPLAIRGDNRKVFQCQYHGWTYFLDGMLRGVPDWDRVELFDKKDYGLTPVQVDSWEGLVFVNLAENPAPLATLFEGIRERIAPISLGQRQFYRRIAYAIQCNWKVYMDNYLEGYHLPIVHPELSKLLDYSRYVTEVFPGHSLQYSPFQAGDNLYAGSDADGDAFYYTIHPNFMLNILPGRLQTNLVLPVAADRCTVIFDYYYDDITSPTALAMIEEDLAYSDRIQGEDIEVCELVQIGLSSKGYDRGRFSVKREEGVYHFQCWLKETFGQAIQMC